MKYRETEPFKVDRNGTKYYHDYTCRRCGGNGVIPHFGHVDGGVCFECGGSGRSSDHVFKVYTAEYEKKLEERRAKAQAKKDAEAVAEAPKKNAEFFSRKGFNEKGEAFMILGNTYEIKEELKAKGCRFDAIIGWYSAEDLSEYDTAKITADEIFDKNNYGWFIGYSVEGAKSKVEEIKSKYIEEHDKSEYVGEIGKRIEMNVKYTHRASFSRPSYRGYGEETMFVYYFKDENGNTLVWVTGSWLDNEKGDTIRIKATVKEHKVYRDKKQTVVKNVKVVA